MSYIPGDKLSKKGQTIRQFCREFKYDYPVIFRICELLCISRNADKIYIIDSFDGVRIVDYIKKHSEDPQINADADYMYHTCSKCDRKVAFKAIEINRNTTQWVICTCGRKIDVTNRMIVIDK
jgi:hypothetical protein